MFKKELVNMMKKNNGTDLIRCPIAVSQQIWYLKSKLEIIAGVDEAGRGPLAGPVVAAAVILPDNHSIEGLADSKKLSPKKREKLFEKIQAVSDVGVGIISHKKIDKINILQGTYQAMRQALDSLVLKPESISVPQVTPNP